MDIPDRRSADARSVCLGACRDHSNYHGESRDLASRSFGKGRRHHRMDQQGRLRPHRDGAKRRVGRDATVEKDPYLGIEESRNHRLLLPLPSEHESDPRSRAMRSFETCAVSRCCRKGGWSLTNSDSCLEGGRRVSDDGAARPRSTAALSPMLRLRSWPTTSSHASAARDRSLPPRTWRS